MGGKSFTSNNRPQIYLCFQCGFHYRASSGYGSVDHDFSGNKIRWFTWFAIGMSTVGIALLSLGDSLSFGLGDLLILGCAFAFALLTESSELGISSFTQSTVLSLIFCGVVATALAFLVQSSFQRFSSPVKTALIFTCEPVFGAIFSVWIASKCLIFSSIWAGQ